MKSGCFLFLVVLLACDEKGEPEPKPEAFLTVTLSDDYFVSDDMWVFATDETGKVLDSGPVTPGSSLVLKTSSPPDFINLTEYYKGAGPLESHVFFTYAGIKSGEEIKFERGRNSGILPPKTGKATIKIQNCNPYSSLILSDGHTDSQFVTQGSTSIDALLDLRQDTSNILVSAHLGIDQPVYGWVNNVTDGGVYAIDFNTLTPFPRTVSVGFTESLSAIIVGRKAGVGSLGYVMTNGGFSKVSPDFALAKFGYLEGFDKYEFLATESNTLPDQYRAAFYLKHGSSLPEEVAFTSTSLGIGSSLISNFSFVYSSTYTYCDHFWREDATDHMIQWRVYTDKSTSPPITELPEAFSAQHPSISLTNLTYVQSEFFRHEDGYTYDLFLHDMFAGITREHQEYFADYFQQK